MNPLIDAVNRLRNVPRTQLAGSVKRVLVILGNSRSGSSLLKTMLANHPRMASMDGEIDPLLALTGNGFGHNAASDSDAIGVLSNPARLADNIFDELGLPCAAAASPAWLRGKWEKRCLLQFPALFADGEGHRRLLHALDLGLAQIDAGAPADAHALRQSMLATLFCDTPWRIHYYDGNAARGPARCFDEAAKIEEPPFVLPRHDRRPCSALDLERSVLLFKAPSDAYRIGMYEQLFPNARIDYLHLSRGYAQSVNGLMDGWLSPLGFFAHDLGRAGLELDIQGYSDTTPFGKRWWKFDLPPNWRQFTGASLDEVCLNQWMSAQRAILDSGVAALRVRFEDFLAQPAAEMARITDHLDLPALALPEALPVLMATDTPRPLRWHKRQELLLTLGERRDVRALMDALGYRMQPGLWR